MSVSEEMMTTPPRQGAAPRTTAASAVASASAAPAPAAPEPAQVWEQVDLWTSGQAFRLERQHALVSPVLAEALALRSEARERGTVPQVALPAMDPAVFRVTVNSLRSQERAHDSAWAAPLDAEEYRRQLDYLDLGAALTLVPSTRGDDVPPRLRRCAEDLGFALRVFDDIQITYLLRCESEPLAWTERARGAFMRHVDGLAPHYSQEAPEEVHIRLPLLDLDWGPSSRDVRLAMSCAVERSAQAGDIEYARATSLGVSIGRSVTFVNGAAEPSSGHLRLSP